MEQYAKAQYVKRRLNVRNIFRKAKRYTIIGASVLGFAYLADTCNASHMINAGASETKDGIEYLVNKF